MSIMGIEKNNERNKGIKIIEKGIKNLNESSNVREWEIQ